MSGRFPVVWRLSVARERGGCAIALAISAAMLAGCGEGRPAHAERVVTPNGATTVARDSLPTGESVAVEVARSGSGVGTAVEITSVVQKRGARLRGPAASVTAPRSGGQPAALALLPRCRGPHVLAVVAFGAVRGLRDSVTAVEQDGRVVRLKTSRLPSTIDLADLAVLGVLHAAPREILVSDKGRLVERERYTGIYARLCAA